MAIVTTSRNLTAYQATSSTSFDTSNVSKTITISTGKAFYVGQLITVAPVGAVLPSRLRGLISSYDAGTGALTFASNTNPWVEADVTSVTSLTVGTGSKTLTIAPNLGLTAGDPITIQQISNNGRYMVGTVTSYNSSNGVLVANITVTGSSGTYTDWNVYSNATFSNWTITNQQADIIEIRNGAKLTIDATPITRPGTVQCITSGELEIVNSNPTVPLIFDLHDMNHDLRFEAGGIFRTRGAPMSLGAGNGLQKTWDFTSLFGGVIRHMTHVEIEEVTGSGVYMPWPVIAEDPKFNLNSGLLATIGGAVPTDFTAGNTPAGRVLFWHETNRTLRCGDGTNGAVIPNGCAVRIPNIYVSNRLLTNQTSVLNLITFGTPTGGTFTIEISRENGQVIGTTAAIPFNATNAQVDTAIEAITGAGTVTPGGGPLPTAVTITWAGAYANERLGVRIANNSLTGGTNPHVVLYENNVANCSLLDLNPLGTFDAEWASFSDKFLLSVETFKSFRSISCGFGNSGVRLINSNGSIEIDGFSNNRSPFVSMSTFDVTSVLGEVSLERMVSASKLSSFNPQNLPNLKKFDRVTTFLYGQRQSANNRAFGASALPSGTVITNLTTIGAAPNFANMTNSKVVNWSYADGCQLAQNTLQAQSAAVLQNCADVTFAGYFQAGPMSFRNYLLSLDTFSKGIKVLGAEGAMEGNGIGGLLMQCSGVEVSNGSFTNARANPLIDLPANYLGNNLTVKKVFNTFSAGQPTAGLDACQGGVYDLVSSTPLGITETFSGVNDFVGGNYADTSLTPTTGHVTFGPFGEGAGLTLMGAAFTDALGAFLLPEAGDSATVTMPFAMHGITGFQNTVPLIYADVPGALANQHVLAAPGVPTGGTFTLSVFDASGTLIGTTTPIGFGSNGSTITNSIQSSVPAIGVGNVTCSNSLTAGGTITFTGALAGQAFYVTIDGSNLTGGTEPGVAYVYGRARLMSGTESLGANITSEFAIRKPGTAWPSWQALTGANLAAAIPALSGYAPGGAGLEMRIRLTTSVASAYTKINQISLPTNIDPDLWFVGDATITFTNVASTDTVELRKVAGNALITTFTGGGMHELDALDNFGASVYLVRKNAGGTVLKTTIATPFNLTVDSNGTFDLTAVSLKNADGSAMSSFVVKNGVPLGWVSLATERVLQAEPTDVFNVYAHAYGTQPKLVTITGNAPSDFVISLVPETFVDTTQTNRDTIAAAFSNGLDAFGRFYLAVDTDLRQYSPAQVLHALHWHTLTQGQLIGYAALVAGNLNGFALMRGGFVIRTPGFYGKVADSVTTTGNLGILVPLSIYIDPAVYTVMPTYTAVEKNTSGIVLQYAPWTQAEADIPSWVAKEETSQAIKSNTGLIPALL